MEKLPWNPSKDVIRVSANNLGIDIDRAIYTAMAIDYSRQSTERAEKNNIVRLGMCNVNIRKVIFNDPATVVLWSDGTKTVVKCGPDDIFDKEKGLAMAIVKKMAGNDSRFHNQLRTHRLDKPLLKAIGTPTPNAIPDTISSSIICNNLLTTIMPSARKTLLIVRSVHLWPTTSISMRNLSVLQQNIQLLHLSHVIPNPEFPGFLRHVSHFCISFRQPPWSLRFYAEYKAHSQPDYHTRMKPIVQQ